MIGWDIFNSANKAASVCNQLSPPHSLSSSESSSLSGDEESLDGSTTSDNETRNQMNGKPAFTLFQDSEIDSDIEHSSQSNPSFHHNNSSDSDNCGKIEKSNLSSSEGNEVKS